MKTQVLIILLGLCCVSARAQNCDKIVQKIEVAYRAGRLDEALTQIRALRACDVSEQGKKLADTWTEKVYKSVQAQKDLAQSSLTKANRLIRHFNFDDEKAAWAYKDGLFAVIDRNGNTLTDFMYENPEPFNNGVAIAGINNQYVFVNDRGEEVSERYDYLILTGFNNRVAGRDLELEVLLGANGRIIHKDIQMIDIDGSAFESRRLYLDDSIWIDNSGEASDSSGNIQIYIVYEKNGFYGIVDQNGREIIPPKYHHIGVFQDGIAQISIDSENGEKWGLISIEGREIIAPQYEYIDQLQEGISVILKDGLWGCVDRNGISVIPPQYEDIGFFQDGMVKIKKDGLWGFFDIAGRKVIPFQYENAKNFINETALVQKDGKWNFINKKGINPVLGLYNYVGYYSEGLSCAQRNGKMGYLDTTGRIIIPLEFNETSDFFEGRATVSKNKKWIIIDKYGQIVGVPAEEKKLIPTKKTKWGYIDQNGELIIPFQFDTVGWEKTLWSYNIKGHLGSVHTYAKSFDNFPEGLERVKKNNKFGFIDKTGQVIIPLEYQDTGQFYEGLAPVKQDNLWGFINKKGQMCVSVQFDSAGCFYKGRAPVKKGNFWGFIDKTGQIIGSLQFETVNYFIEGLARVKKHNRWGLIDTTGQVVAPFIYDEIWEFSGGLAIVQKDSLFGFIDEIGREIIPPIYEDAWHYIGWWVGVRKNGHLSMRNVSGSLTISVDYLSVQCTPDGLVEVTDTYFKYGLLDTLGRELLPCQYQLHRCGYRIYLLEQNGRYGLFAPDYGVRIEPAYEEFGFVDEEFGWIRARKNGKWGWVDKTGEVKIPFRFDAAAPFKDGKARVLQLPYEETFYINEKGEMILGE